MTERQKEIEKLRIKLAEMYEEYEANGEDDATTSLDGTQSEYFNITKFYSEEMKRINKHYPEE